MRRFLRRGCVWRKSRRSVDPGVAAAVDGPAVHGPAVHGPQTEEAADSSRTSSNTSSIAAEAARPPAFLDILVVACLLALCTVGAWLAYDIGKRWALTNWVSCERGRENVATQGGRLRAVGTQHTDPPLAALVGPQLMTQSRKPTRSSSTPWSGRCNLTPVAKSTGGLWPPRRGP